MSLIKYLNSVLQNTIYDFDFPGKKIKQKSCILGLTLMRHAAHLTNTAIFVYVFLTDRVLKKYVCFN